MPNSGSNNLTTYYAKRIIGDTAAASAANALLQTGTEITTDIWILSRTNRSNTYGIKYVYDNTVSGTNDKIELYGNYLTGNNDINTPTAWVNLHTGDIYILGKVGIGYNPETSGNTYKLYVNGTSYLNDNARINGNLYFEADKDIYFNYNSTDWPILDNANNGDVSLNACGENLLLGYNKTSHICMYYTNSDNSVRTEFFEINDDGAYALTRFGVNGQNTSYNLYVNGSTYHNGNIYLGGSNGCDIYYAGTQATYRMIRFIDNTGDTYGNGISIGGGGLTVLGSGESADTILSNLSLTASGGTETTYIASDGNILFYPGQNNYDASALITMSPSRIWAGVNGDTTREAQAGCQSGAGQIYLWSAAATNGARGLYVPAHGTGSAKAIINVDTNNYIEFNGHVISPDAAVSYIAGAKGSNAGLYAKKSSGARWYPAVTLQTSGGGAWQIGNYNDETLEFQYATAANINNQTNSTSEIYMQNGDTGRVMTSGNYTNWTVTKTGSGASGTWGISITGNAASATYVKDRTNNTASYLNYGASGLGYDSYTYLAGWNGYELRAVAKSQFARVNHTNINGTARNLQIRYGGVTLNNNSQTTVTFSPAFSNACLAVIPYDAHLGFAAPQAISVGSVTKSNCKMYQYNAQGAACSAAYVAFGY